MSCVRTLFELTLLAAVVLESSRLAAETPFSSDFGYAPLAGDRLATAMPPLSGDLAPPEHTRYVPSDEGPPIGEPMSPDDVFVEGEVIYPESEGPVGLRDLFPLYTGHPSLEHLAPVSDELFHNGFLYSIDYDAFRSVPDGSWENNGIRFSANYGTKLGHFSDVTGIGLQVGASIGAYDWGGTDYRQKNRNKVQSQGFFTYGLFRRPREDSYWSAALVQDWSFNDTYGVFGENPTMSQLRGQVGYAVTASNEFGLSGAVSVRSDSREVAGFGHTTYRPINTLSGYWHHKWHRGGPDTWISVGVPAKTRLKGGGSVGDWLVSATALCPLSDAVSIFSNVMYMHQSAGAPKGANDEAWNFTVGISVYPRRNSRTQTVAGERWMPLLPTANNGSFVVDASNNY